MVLKRVYFIKMYSFVFVSGNVHGHVVCYNNGTILNHFFFGGGGSFLSLLYICLDSLTFLFVCTGPTKKAKQSIGHKDAAKESASC